MLDAPQGNTLSFPVSNKRNGRHAVHRSLRCNKAPQATENNGFRGGHVEEPEC